MQFLGRSYRGRAIDACGPGLGQLSAKVGVVKDNETKIAASKSNVFFTVKLLVEVGLTP
jgi:hypothetical protein